MCLLGGLTFFHNLLGIYLIIMALGEVIIHCTYYILFIIIIAIQLQSYFLRMTIMPFICILKFIIITLYESLIYNIKNYKFFSQSRIVIFFPNSLNHDYSMLKISIMEQLSIYLKCTTGIIYFLLLFQ